MRLLLLLVVLTAGCVGGRMEVVLQTDDGVRIEGTFYDSEASAGIVLLHQLGGSREQWSAVVEKLTPRYKVLAIDLRGHGASEGDYMKFTDDDFRAMANDVDAAVKFLDEHGVERIVIVGSSIGANMAINYGAERGIDSVVALSPSFNYRGIETYDGATAYRGRLLVVASSEDAQSFANSQEIVRLSPSENKKFVALNGAGHGVQMLPVAWNDIDAWLRENG